MSISIRILVALHAVALLTTTVFSPNTPFVVATPFPVPMPLMVADFPRSPAFGDVVSAWSKTPRSLQSNVTQALLPRIHSPSFSDSSKEIHIREDSEDISGYHTEFMNRWEQLKQCHDANECISLLSSLRDGLRELWQRIGCPKSNKGTSNYVKSDKLQTILKDIVNVLKCIVEDLVKHLIELLDGIPLIGSLLGGLLEATLYDLKCIVDELLDCVEVQADATLNALTYDCQNSWNNFCGEGILGLSCLL